MPRACRMFAAVLALLSTAGACADEKVDPKTADYKSAIVGVWEMLPPDAAKVEGSITMEFTKDAKVKMVIDIKGAKTATEGSFKIDADKLTLIRTRNGQEEAETATIKALGADKLVFVSKGRDLQFKRAGVAVKAEAPNADGIDPKKLVGAWETPDKSGTVKFTEDGKLVFTVNGLTVEGRYKLQGNKMIATMSTPDGKQITETMIVKSLKDDRLVTVDSSGKEESLKRTK